jgi:hypothetical protein
MKPKLIEYQTFTIAVKIRIEIAPLHLHYSRSIDNIHPRH